MGKLFRDKNTEAATELQEQSRLLGNEEKELDAQADQLEEQLTGVLLRIPNMPADDCPDGAGEADNVVLRTEQFDPDSYADHQRVPHWEVADQLGILDIERAVKMSGSMFTMYRGQGAALARALCQLALDRNVDASRRSGRRRWSRRRRLCDRVSCRSSPTTPTASSATTCGASPRPRCR